MVPATKLLGNYYIAGTSCRSAGARVVVSIIAFMMGTPSKIV